MSALSIHAVWGFLYQGHTTLESKDTAVDWGATMDRGRKKSSRDETDRAEDVGYMV